MHVRSRVLTGTLCFAINQYVYISISYLILRLCNEGGEMGA